MVMHIMAGRTHVWRLQLPFPGGRRRAISSCSPIRAGRPATPEFANAIDNAYPGRADMEDLLGGVDHLVGRGLVDEDRLYVTGCSGGVDHLAGRPYRPVRGSGLAVHGPTGSALPAGRYRGVEFQPFANWKTRRVAGAFTGHACPSHHHADPVHDGAEDLRTPLAQAEEVYANRASRRSVHADFDELEYGTWSVPSTCAPSFICRNGLIAIRVRRMRGRPPTRPPHPPHAPEAHGTLAVFQRDAVIELTQLLGIMKASHWLTRRTARTNKALSKPRP